MTDDELYPCLGICLADSESGRCVGCGRPLVLITPAESESAPQNESQASETLTTSENK